MADSRRADRIAEAIRTEVATFLTDSAKDPRLRALVTVTGVDVARDLRHARVFVSLLGDEDARTSTLEGLQNLAPHLRAHLGKVLRVRAAPEITFRIDESIARAARIDALIAEARANDAATGRRDDES